MMFRRKTKRPSELEKLLTEWRRLKARCEAMAVAIENGTGDLEEYCALLDERKDIADKAVKALEAEMDTGHVSVPDTEAMLGVLNENAEGRCRE